MVQNNANDFNSKWFDIAKDKSDNIGGEEPTLPRHCSRQRSHDNVPADEPVEYYKRSISRIFD